LEVVYSDLLDHRAVRWVLQVLSAREEVLQVLKELLELRDRKVYRVHVV
jgi:hypothetical protein